MGGQQTKHGLSDKFVGAMLLGTAIMNAIDLLMTLWLVKTGLATEANPLMRIALNAGVVAFAFSKVTLVTIGAAYLWSIRCRPVSRYGSVLVFFVYLYVMTHHAQAIKLVF